MAIDREATYALSRAPQSKQIGDKPMPSMKWYREVIASMFLLTFCSAYYVVPALSLIGLIGSMLGSWPCIYLLATLIFLAFVPMPVVPSFRNGYVMSCVVEYFDFKWIDDREITDMESHWDSIKKCLVCWFPHGIIPLAAKCSAYFLQEHHPTSFGRFALLKLPIIRQIISPYNCMGADNRSMMSNLGRVNVSLYPGGIAQIFLCNRDTEEIYLSKRKGFCKLALIRGCDIVPIYVYGATQILDSRKPKLGSFTERLCRKLGISALVFWGRYYLPLPYRERMTLVCAKAVPVKQTDNPTQEQIDELHAEYTAALVSLYERHRDLGGSRYLKKELIIH